MTKTCHLPYSPDITTFRLASFLRQNSSRHALPLLPQPQFFDGCSTSDTDKYNLLIQNIANIDLSLYSPAQKVSTPVLPYNTINNEMEISTVGMFLHLEVSSAEHY